MMKQRLQETYFTTIFSKLGERLHGLFVYVFLMNFNESPNYEFIIDEL